MPCRSWNCRITKPLILAFFVCVAICSIAPVVHAEPAPQVRVSNVRRVFDNGEHNAFTDLIRFNGRYFLTFRSCPDGHMVHPTASIIILASSDLQSWEAVHQFSVPSRDTRDPHFLDFKGQLFVFTGTWYCGASSPVPAETDLNQQLGYAVTTADGQTWSEPHMLEGTYGHYIWRAATDGQHAYLCGRRKHEFDARPRGDGLGVESALLQSDDGLVWRTHALFQPTEGNETAFQFSGQGIGLGIARRTGKPAQLLQSVAPYTTWKSSELDRFIGGPLLCKWGERWVVGGRHQTADGPRTALCWLSTDAPPTQQLQEFALLPSDGDNSYPGFVELSPARAVVSWYSSHERDSQGRTITAIYMADLERVLPQRQKISFRSSYDQTTQEAYLTVPSQPTLQVATGTAATGIAPVGSAAEENSAVTGVRPVVVSLHSWSADMEQRQPDLEHLVHDRHWYCLQPNFRGVNDHPLACASPAAMQDVLDAVDRLSELYPVDPQRIYVTGNSGGGHMTLMLAAHFPHKWAAASTWVGISDLAAWHATQSGGKYANMLEACCGGAPGSSPDVDAQYAARSPVHSLGNANQLWLDIAAGVHDGHQGSVPILHSMAAFNAVAQSVDIPGVSPVEIAELSVAAGRLQNPQKQDVGFDPSFGRDYYLRRQAHRARLTIFEGGHEGLATAALAWFDAHPSR